MRKSTVAEKREYAVRTVAEVKKIAKELIKEYQLDKVVSFGLPEVDDRAHIWRMSLLNMKNGDRLGEIVINAKTSLVDERRTTKKEILEARILKRSEKNIRAKKTKETYPISPLRNTIGYGDSESLLKELPKNSVDLIFTSPPYFNAKPEYTEYLDYEDYLQKMRKIIKECHRVLADGRFFVLNVSPVLIRRENRNRSSRRIAVPFDFHRIFTDEDFDFIDDIIWQKPEGAGWATGRGRRFAADRNPLQYKPVPVTEYVLVYRKKSDKLIDWFIRNHPNREVVNKSKIKDGYDVTNVWRLPPSSSKKHPAIFPIALAKKVISYYSFINDVVMDPFAGIGTAGIAASKLKRRFVLFDNEKKYIDIIKHDLAELMRKQSESIACINCSSIKLKNHPLL